MTEFRIFCFGFFVGDGLLACLENHVTDAVRPEFAGAGGLLVVGLYVGALAVVTFGKRRQP